jgi:hypothetical protein
MISNQFSDWFGKEIRNGFKELKQHQIYITQIST